MHHVPKLRFWHPRPKFNSAWDIWNRRSREPHVILQLRRIQTELEGPKNKKRIYEHRSVLFHMRSGNHMRRKNCNLLAMC
jgi:hypothetical protein